MVIVPKLSKTTVALLTLLGISTAGVAGVFVLPLLTPDPLDGSVPEQSLEASWAAAIGKYGLEPVFPPEEDIAVGDILAVVVADNDYDPDAAQKKVGPQSPFPKRSVKIAHIDVRQELDDNYAVLPAFVATTLQGNTAKYSQGDKAASDSTTPKPDPLERVFTKGVLEGNLPRAALSSITIDGINSAGVGVSLGSSGSSRQASLKAATEEIRLSNVSTYGLPSAVALERLTEYCTAPETRGNCTDSIARKLLRPAVGKRIDRVYADENGENHPAITVKIVLVNRVYLTRSILHTRRLTGGQGGATWLSARSGATDMQDKQDGASAPSSVSSGEGVDVVAMQKRLETVERELSQIRHGAGVVNRSEYRNEILLQQTLDRAVAFGYRGVQFEPEEREETS